MRSQQRGRAAKAARDFAKPIERSKQTAAGCSDDATTPICVRWKDVQLALLRPAAWRLHGQRVCLGRWRVTLESRRGRAIPSLKEIERPLAREPASSTSSTQRGVVRGALFVWHERSGQRTTNHRRAAFARRWRDAQRRAEQGGSAAGPSERPRVRCIGELAGRQCLEAEVLWWYNSVGDTTQADA